MRLTRWITPPLLAAAVAAATCGYLQPEWENNRVVRWREESAQASAAPDLTWQSTMCYGLNAQDQPVEVYFQMRFDLPDAQALPDAWQQVEDGLYLGFRYTYNRAGQLIATQAFDETGKCTDACYMTYDAYGNRLQERGTRSLRHAYSYDAHGRVLQDHLYQTLEDGTEQLSGRAAYTYTDAPDGSYEVELLEEVLDEGLNRVMFRVHRSMAYDAQGRLLWMEYTMNDRAPNRITYRYDDAGRLVETCRYQDCALMTRQVTEYAADGFDISMTEYDGAGVVQGRSISRLRDRPPA